MGAYYTKEDITDYISKNTIIPYIFDAVKLNCAASFSGEHSIWDHLKADPDRYIYPAMIKGTTLPLPAEIVAGLKEVSLRTEWNKPAAAGFTLPTEIWSEVVVRRERYEEIKGRLSDGRVRQIDELITYNLDIHQFAQDVIQSCKNRNCYAAFGGQSQKLLSLTRLAGPEPSFSQR